MKHYKMIDDPNFPMVTEDIYNSYREETKKRFREMTEEEVDNVYKKVNEDLRKLNEERKKNPQKFNEDTYSGEMIEFFIY